MRVVLVWLVPLLLGCATSGGGPAGAGPGGSSGAGAGGTGGIAIDGSSGGSVCKLAEDSDENSVPVCNKAAPPDAFEPVVQWAWSPPTVEGKAYASQSIPLVANFTDDNNDGSIDLCDTPDIVVTTYELTALSPTTAKADGRMYLLSGDTGELHFTFGAPVSRNFPTPALGDIDNDGLVEVVTVDAEHHLIAFEHDGSVKWQSGETLLDGMNEDMEPVSLYDLDGDGSVEILANFSVFNASGQRLWGLLDVDKNDHWCNAVVAADLEGDAKLEVIFGHSAHRADGSLLWELPLSPGQPQVANLDDDAEPEILLTNKEGLTIIEADGTVKLGPVRPTNPTVSANSWTKPAAIHDFDGDGKADIVAGSASDVSVYPTGTSLIPKWTNPIYDATGVAASTGFDFLGDGVAEVIYSDEQKAYVFDGATGELRLDFQRKSSTIVEYPVVADVDNDGSAEILIVGASISGASVDDAVIVCLGEAQNRWIPTRRIWNQHAYHVTNVREDGTIPKQMKKSWQLLNTFRTNAQIEGTSTCAPPTPR